MGILNEVCDHRPIEFCPYLVNGIHSKPVLGCDPIVLNADRADQFIQLIQNTQWKQVIESDLQSLCEKKDGTQLLTACVDIRDFYQIIDTYSDVFKPYYELIQQWDQAGFNEVVIHFIREHQQTFEEKLEQLGIPGQMIEFERGEAECLGAFMEDALTEEDAMDSTQDVVKQSEGADNGEK